ncbi:pimeloyl-ACP methyl ester carboxylesterase [Chryseobacterium sp. SORGH_AS 447]|uniref:alpha/beta hydrolase family protein n=1 Tax=Chryseobacterium sp. SORGH_AS_0447 TaxID=3041769 RepID=UPI002789E3A0|nr:alpha/beta hydrolase [Chryseobacterium sp. SORGH_AS_0447]MDQ1161064.1 pimeloyl-ACP methyl ester carboxylesterase [Chryseobacterium sp. SORGH_AS_0447]
MKIKTLFVLVSLLFTYFLQAQTIEGSWKGELEFQGMKLPLILNIKKNGSLYSSTMNSPKQGAKDIPVDKTDFANNELSFEQKMLGATYKGKLTDGKIEGTFSQNGMQLPLTFTPNTENGSGLNRPQTPKPPFNYDTEDVSFQNPTDKNTLAGTFAQPENFDKNKPILVLITGSGTQNRDEELFGHKPFAVIADDFAKKGIATLRLHDRGAGSSSKGSASDTSYNFATDINTAVGYLVSKGYKNIGLLGHSEGGMIAPIVAATNKNVKFLVLMAAPGTPVDQLLIQQNEKAGKLMGQSDLQTQQSRKVNSEIYGFIKNYSGNTYEKDLQQFLTKNFAGQLSEEAIQNIQRQTSSAWFRYFLKFNPDSYLSKIKIPVLALNGSLDFQVPAKENLEAISQSLKKAGNMNFKTEELPGLNHLFQEAKTGAFSEYADIEQTISPAAMDKMTDWIVKMKK